MKISISNIFKGDKVIWMIFFFLCIISLIEVFSSSSTLTFNKTNYWGPILKHGGILLMGVALNMGIMGFWLGNAFAGYVPFFIGGVFFLTGRWKSRQLIESKVKKQA